MQRRVFIALVGSMMAWPLGASAQAPAKPVIGFLNSASPGPFAKLLAAFHQGLKEEGYVEGQNVMIEYRWAEGQYDRLPMLAADLVRRQVAVITATGGSVVARAARDATATIPIVFLGGAEPVGIGLVNSFSRPGANVTGVSTFTSELAPKRLELLHELLSKGSKIATLTNPENPTDIEMQQMGAPTGIPGLQLLALKAKAESDFESVFTEAVQQRADAILVSSDAFFNSRRAQLVALAARHGLPAAYAWREYVEAGGLMSYGTSLTGSYQQIGKYVGRILKGAKPADLPVQNPTNFGLALNLTTAKALGLKVPASIMLRANVVIE
jgi:putative tryptophan/tyrosine transport system substrate-binding protein